MIVDAGIRGKEWMQTERPPTKSSSNATIRLLH